MRQTARALVPAAATLLRAMTGEPRTPSRRAEECPACHVVIEPVWVHAHLQCPACKTVILPCCTGETADSPAPTRD
jgi:predicted RNA-binding Zn-ribbon protein involved in translation (DUF1610 family)